MYSSEDNRNQTNNMHLDTELLSAYIDGEVVPAEVQRVERHLQECQRCSEELDSLRWTVELLAETPAVPVPRSFAVRQADIEPELAPQRFTLPNWLVNSLQWATVATAILAVLVFSADFLIWDGLGQAPAQLAAPEAAQESQAPAPMAAEAPAEAPTVELESEEALPAPAEERAQKERPQALELANGPQEQPAPSEDEPSIAQMEAAPEAMPEEEATGDSPVESLEEPKSLQDNGSQQPEPAPAAAVSEQERMSLQPRDWLRPVELALLGLLIILLPLTLWARRQVP